MMSETEAGTALRDRHALLLNAVDEGAGDCSRVGGALRCTSLLGWWGDAELMMVALTLLRFERVCQPTFLAVEILGIGQKIASTAKMDLKSPHRVYPISWHVELLYR